jgi:hypothetical protein
MSYAGFLRVRRVHSTLLSKLLSLLDLPRSRSTKVYPHDRSVVLPHRMILNHRRIL